jgi:putative NIF3 family GTP cyclohydrolase 1 type 2
MTVQELFDHFMTGATWVDRQRTPDAIEAGDPGQCVRRVGVGWTACTQNLRAAAADGCDLFVSHEPSFCEYWEPQAGYRTSAWGRRRTDILARHGMALMALHDAWDIWPTYGIRDSWMQCLGLNRPLAFRAYTYAGKTRNGEGLSLHAIPPCTLDEFARRVAVAVRPYRAAGVWVMGDGAAPVAKVAVGVGCWIPTFEMLELGADALVVVFDRAFQTVTRQPLLDLGAGLVVLEHGTVEMPGMRNLAGYLGRTFPEIEARFYCHEPVTRFVTA